MLRKMLDRMHPMFDKGGKFEKLYPLYEAQDTFLYTPGEVTKGATQVRDGIDLKRMMSMVIVALIPCVLMAMYNTGFQSSRIIAKTVAETSTYQPAGWQYAAADAIGVDYAHESYTEDNAFYKSLIRPMRLIHCVILGALFFLPVYIVTMVAGGLSEVVFSIIRGHEINEGFLVTGMLFPLTLPPTIPLWQVALGIIFGVVIAKEIFGGTGMNFLNVALTARAFLYFNNAPRMSGADVWTGVDGNSGATALGQLADDGTMNMVGSVSTITESGGKGDVVLKSYENSLGFFDAFIGNMHGSMGETSALACLIGAAVLIAVGIGSWRIMVGVVAGAFATAALFNIIGAVGSYQETKDMLDVLPWTHMVIGGFAFGTVFMATDPVSASMTEFGKWIYGGLIGAMTIFIRVLNPAFPEGIMLAILFGNVFAPLIDYFVVQANIRRRLARNEAG